MLSDEWQSSSVGLMQIVGGKEEMKIIKFLQQCLFTAIAIPFLLVCWLYNKLTGKDLVNWRM
jgi:hypothetical protein